MCSAVALEMLQNKKKESKEKNIYEKNMGETLDGGAWVMWTVEHTKGIGGE